ncbi:exodeoxyribonuclease V subunit beta [Azohydromonas aeria]|uniref:exodeoxyribonuclease V subunit beta n=1 Tax=Azohydromonas aeria TaxID=2590212 RepID=UPI0012F78143|nr:exodeoxyribonuclease V subunit beta [Azohydromonas aeria]
MSATALEALRFPLRGSRLIEASAGTGKTFTIAALYLRLVLGHGIGDDAFGRALTPPEILVVTFTDAATKELRDRIRARLAEAAQAFLADPAQVAPRAAGEDLLHDLRAEYPAADWPACARRLQLAAEWMDEAAVSTIHGWCNRMLREHAFDSGSLFTQRLETDQSALLAEVVRDYWRCFMVPLDEDAVRRVAQWWGSPAALQAAIAGLLPHVGRLAAAAAPLQALATAQAAHAQRLAELKAPWREWVDELQALIEEAREQKLFNARSLNRSVSANWLAALAQWRDDPAQVQPALTDTAWERLTPEGLQAIWNAGAEPPRHPALEALRALREEIGALPIARDDLLRHAAHWITARFDVECLQRAEMGFDDLLKRLDAALAGPHGPRLAAVIRRQFPVALIDEFQDTDALQYRIFDAVYRVRDNAPDTAVVLIGDPKQAIYAFRGADIHTYLAARADTADRHYTLRRNFRSTHAMVEAVNHCFDIAEQRQPGPGAFRFRTATDDPVPFLTATARGRDDALVVEGREAPALTVWRLPDPDDGTPCGKGAYIDDMAQVCASEMVRLLNLGQRGQAGFAGADGRWRGLQPGDMAVLVNNRDEAGAIRAALSARGVRSVYLSERDSVYQRPEALEVQHWLAACAAPEDGRALRAALATPTLALDWGEMDRLNRDEAAWDERVLQFRGYQEGWRRQGVLPMLRRLLHDFGVPARLLGDGTGGERRLTDLLHLAELLQQASAQLDGEHALVRHLAEQRGQPGAAGSGDARQLRLESDADLVQVITIHKSKGLEYPLVFLPFACSFRAAKPTDTPLKWHDEEGRLQLDLGGSAAAVAAADEERLGEDLRKLYVALTRARYATWLGTAPVEGLGRSAFGCLIGGDLRAGVDALQAGCAHIHVDNDPQPGEDRFAGPVQVPAAGGARLAERRLRELWWVASYSALQLAAREGGATAQEEVFREAAAHALPAVPPLPAVLPAAAPSAGLLHGFPRGAAVGTFLHELLEWAAKQGFAQVVQSPALLRDVVARRCALRGWEAWIEPLCAWLQDLLVRPLPVPGAPPLTLAGLGGAVAEMEFWMGVREVDALRLDTLVCRHTLGASRRAPLQPAQLNGMLRGFIDLVAEHDGRYWVIDYKSNWLGPDDGAYGAEALCREVAGRRYELQSALYLLALHRLLQLRLPDYDYERHIGGALCLFLRGSQAECAGVHAERPPRALIEALDRLFSRRTALETA